VLLSSLLQVLPATSSWLPSLPHLESLVLLVFSLMAVHHLSRGKALADLLIPPGLVLTFAGAIVLTAHISQSWQAASCGRAWRRRRRNTS
jgi:hypothetical protein